MRGVGEQLVQGIGDGFIGRPPWAPRQERGRGGAAPCRAPRGSLGFERPAQDVGRLLVGQVLPVGQGQRGPLLLPQDPQGPGKVMPRIGPSTPRGGEGGSGVGSGTSPGVREEGVVGEAVKPGSEAGLPPEGAEPPVGGQEGLLGEVVGAGVGAKCRRQGAELRVHLHAGFANRLPDQLRHVAAGIQRAWHKKYADTHVEFGFNSVAGYTTGLCWKRRCGRDQSRPARAAQSGFQPFGQPQDSRWHVRARSDRRSDRRIHSLGQFVAGEGDHLKLMTVWPHELASGKPIYRVRDD